MTLSAIAAFGTKFVPTSCMRSITRRSSENTCGHLSSSRYTILMAVSARTRLACIVTTHRPLTSTYSVQLVANLLLHRISERQHMGRAASWRRGHCIRRNTLSRIWMCVQTVAPRQLHYEPCLLQHQEWTIYVFAASAWYQAIQELYFGYDVLSELITCLVGVGNEYQ